ncbi:MAG TPA: UDP-N-acetylmuramate dehydrogenase [Candidatus Acutalibacter pullistercoris]|uniref:UDP-N-acetylenolpyruvoylglucosamine reductase n=1 Tax=Candidatus Acutalibacter pullistercoris TaxID=2838418 RepID=A0A9D1YC50_9FIRM|nr:UDP-N-acetylmuramate dehydrogenase [Candidatus Acutalibacter pullistercoris]
MLDYRGADQAARELGCRIQEGEPLAPRTTFRIGGPADRLYTLENLGQLKGLLQALEQGNIPRMVLGKGSNLLVSDKGYRGAVLALAGEFQKVELLPGGRVLAGAGAPLASVCAFARDRGLSGLEFAWGIPGSIGGAAYMDAGAYGGEMKDVVVKVRHLTSDGREGEAQGEDLAFGYRKSRYVGSGEIITQVEFQLEPGEPAAIAGKMEELMGRRKDKQPYDMPSAGSVFKRPEGHFAGTLIEQAGLKGRSVGGAQVSPKHAGFIVNTGGATCQDVLDLIALIQKTVQEKFGVALEPEVRVTGEV